MGPHSGQAPLCFQPMEGLGSQLSFGTELQAWTKVLGLPLHPDTDASLAIKPSVRPDPKMPACRGDYWAALRAGIQPMFHSASLEGYTSSINKAVDVLSDNLHSAAERGEVVDMWRQLGKMTMQVGQPCCLVLGSRREL